VIWEFLNSKLGLLVVGFILTSIVGVLLTAIIQNSTWKRQIRLELHRKRYEEGSTFLDSLSRSIGERYFMLQRWFWLLEQGHKNAAETAEAKYFETVSEWNCSYWTKRNKIRLLVGEGYADRFLDYADDSRPEAPQSLHYIFVQTHSAVLDAKANGGATADTQIKLVALNHACSNFLEEVTTEFVRRARTLELLETPSNKE
jgi:hypothetical protein